MLNLSKGEILDLKKDNPTLKNVMLGAGWDVVEGVSLDADLSALLLTDGKLASSQDVVYFGNLKATGIQHSGDNLTGEGDGDDEQIVLKLEELHDSITSVVFVLNIFKAAEKNQTLKMLSEAVIRAVDNDTQQEIARFTVKEESSDDDCIILCEVKKNGEFKAIGDTFKGDLNTISQKYS